MAYQAPRSGAPVYELNTRIRYSEVDHRGTLTIPALINCFQDCSTFQSAEIGMNIGKLHEERLGWVLTHWQIVIDRYPGLCEHVVVGTFPSSFKGVAATRFFYMRDAQGELIARAVFHAEDEATLAEVRARTAELLERHPLYPELVMR